MSEYNQNDTQNESYNSTPPKNWLVESILVTIFCCLPFGIAGIVYAAKVESKFDAGDIDGAQNAANEAKKWTIISFVLGIISAVLGFLFGIIIPLISSAL
ncbi:MAG: hypothetical protein ACJAU0_002607 [Flavobacteriales bacterium]|jgi:hypothetical protein